MPAAGKRRRMVSPIGVLLGGVRQAEELVMPKQEGLRVHAQAGKLDNVAGSRRQVDTLRLLLPCIQAMRERRQERVIPAHCPLKVSMIVVRRLRRWNER